MFSTKAHRPKPPLSVRVNEDPVTSALVEAERSGLIPTGRRLLVAVSGGGDSLALMHALHELSGLLNLGEIVVGHVDHGLRPDSWVDSRVVGDLAESLGLECHVSRVDVEGEGGLQASARRARYDALESIRAATGAKEILTGHTMDDQAETILLRLARGTSISGMSGIRPRHAHLVRPLLGVTRADLLAYCRRHGLDVRNDPANEDPRYRRSRVRHEIIPLLEDRLGPGVREALCRLAEISREEDRVLDGLATTLEKRSSGEGLGLEVEPLVDAPPAIARRVLARAWWKAAHTGSGPGSTPPPLENRHIERLLEGLRRGGSWQLDLPGGMSAALSCDRLVFAPRPWPSLDPVRITGPGSYDISPAGLSLEAKVTNGGSAQATPDLLRIPWPSECEVVVRGWRSGDRLLEGPKVSEVLLKARVPRPLRPRIPVLLAGGQLLWVVGLRAPTSPPPPGAVLEIAVVREGTARTEG